MVNHMHNFRPIKKLLDLLAPSKFHVLGKIWKELVNPTVFWLTWNFAYGWPMGIVGLGKKISKIKNLFYSAFFDLNKNQFRYVVNLLHKLQASRGGVQKWSKIPKQNFFIVTEPIHTWWRCKLFEFHTLVFSWDTLLNRPQNGDLARFGDERFCPINSFFLNTV